MNHLIYLVNHLNYPKNRLNDYNFKPDLPKAP